LRKKYICPNQIKKGMSGVKDSIRFLNEGSSIALMVDQRVSEGEILPFFEKNCFLIIKVIQKIYPRKLFPYMQNKQYKKYIKSLDE